MRIAKVLVVLRRHDEAIELCRRFASSAPSPFTAVLAEALANTGDYDQAFELLGLALDRHPTGDLYHLRSLLWSRVRLPERACADLDAALERKPNDAVFQFAKALVLVRMGCWREAWAYWEARWRRPDFWHRPEFDLGLLANGGCAGTDVNDFAHTAAIVQQLDLIVCVDTAVAHVAGALGRRVWILLSYGAGALWMLDRSDTPFYPTALLFRQPAPGAWELAIRQ